MIFNGIINGLLINLKIMSTFLKNPIVHAIVTVILFLIPLIVASGGSWQQMTLGGILAAAYEALKNKSSGLTAMGSVR